MTHTQVEYAGVILASGNDLLGCSTASSISPRSSRARHRRDGTDVSVRTTARRPIREFITPPGSRPWLSDRISPDCPVTFVTDPQRLRQVLKNLIPTPSNSPNRATVHLRVSAHRRMESRSRRSPPHDRFSVRGRDTGIGIEGRQQRRIFEAFAQGDGTTARLTVVPGSGSRSVASSWTCSAARSPWRAHPARRQHVHRLPPRELIHRDCREPGAARAQ